MRRGAAVLVFVMVGSLILSSSAWAEEAKPKAETTPANQYDTTPSNLKGIKEALRGIKDVAGGYLAFRIIPWSAIGMVGLMLLAAALSPARVARAEQALRRGRWKVALVGVVSIVVLFIAAMGLGSAAKGGARGLGLLAAVLLGFLVWLAVHGLAATAKIVGRRLMNDEDGTQPPWRVVGAGGLVVAGTLLVPLFGWAVFVYLLCRGVGAGTLALFAGGGSPAESSSEQPPDLDNPPAAK